LLQQDIVGGSKIGNIFLELRDFSSQRHILLHEVAVVVTHPIPRAFSRGFVVIPPSAVHRFLGNVAEFAIRPSVTLVVKEIFADLEIGIPTTPTTWGTWYLPGPQVVLFLLVGHVKILARASMARAVLEIAAYHWLVLRLAAQSVGVRKLAFIPAAANASLEISADLLVFFLVVCARGLAFHRHFARVNYFLRLSLRRLRTACVRPARR
jgi:hypothetical protein